MREVESVVTSFSVNPIVSPSSNKPLRPAVKSVPPHALNGDDVNYAALQCIYDIVTQKPTLQMPESLIKYPPAEELQGRYWLHKRGHVVRTWKRRYCVLDRAGLKYYKEASDVPPFGKGYKGGLALLGAVIVVKTSEDRKTINVDLYGNLGEKDLFFYVENDKKGQSFVRIVEWAIRKITLTMLTRNLKAAMTEKRVEARKKCERHSCNDWTKQQQELFQVALTKLANIQLVHCVNFHVDGSIHLQPGLLRLWTAFGNDYQLTKDTEAKQYGIAWRSLERNEFAGMKQQGVGMDEAQYRMITCEDIEDMYFQYLDTSTSIWLRQHVAPFYHPKCLDQEYVLVTIRSAYCHDVHILACGLDDYQGNLLALQNVLLFVAKEHKLRATATVPAHPAAKQLSVAAALQLLSA
jgi:hypothetical protein